MNWAAIERYQLRHIFSAGTQSGVIKSDIPFPPGRNQAVKIVLLPTSDVIGPHPQQHGSISLTFFLSLQIIYIYT